MTNFGNEILEKAKKINNIEELLVLAKENNIELTAEQAKAYFAQLNQKNNEFTDEELSNVAGGAGFSSGYREKDTMPISGDGRS